MILKKTRLMRPLFLGLLAVGAVSMSMISFNSLGSEDPKDSKEATKEANKDPKDEKEVKETPKASSKNIAKSSGCLVNEAAIEDIKKAREDLESKRKELEEKESELKLKETALNEEIKKIEGIRDSISRTVKEKNREKEEKVNKLVETFTTMSPKAAAKVLAALDEGLAVAAMSQIDTPRLAKILNTMDPKSSTRLSELLAGVVQAKEPVQKGTVKMIEQQEKKGGISKDGHNEQSSGSGNQQPKSKS